MRRLILSPHNDDAVLSLGGHIANWVAAGDEVLVLNFFTVSNYVNPATRKTPMDVARARADEEENAAKCLGYEYKQLGLFDKPIRSVPDEITQAAVRAIINKEYVQADCQVYVPLSGSHRDHDIVRMGANDIPRERRHYYEDLPYAMVTFPPEGTIPTMAHIDIFKKLEAVRKYETQVDGILEFMIRGYAHNMADDMYYERVWE